MKRLLLILLLALMPLQASWAVVATYCQHEKEVNTQHFGHHEHEHKQAKTDKEPKEGSIELDADCITCHGLAAAMLMPVADELPFTPLARAYTPKFSQLESIPSSPPEKPQWPFAV